MSELLEKNNMKNNNNNKLTQEDFLQNMKFENQVFLTFYFTTALIFLFPQVRQCIPLSDS